jgi:hypothetical protein
MNDYWNSDYWNDDYWEDDYWPLTIDEYREEFRQISKVTLVLAQTSEIVLEKLQISDVTIVFQQTSKIEEE